MWYLDKKGILEHLGKDGKDVRWLDRAISKGIVWHDVEDTGGYVLCTEYIEELQEENAKLMIKAGLLPGYKLNEEEEEKKEEKSEPVVSENADVKKLKEDLCVLETNAKYWEDLNKKKKEILNQIFNDIYLDAHRRGSTENIEDFATRMSEKYGYNPKED